MNTLKFTRGALALALAGAILVPATAALAQPYDSGNSDYDAQRAQYDQQRRDYDARYGEGASDRYYSDHADQYGEGRRCARDQSNNEVAGGVIGALAGAAIGSNVARGGGRTGGAVIGGVAGAVVGADVAKGATDC